MNLTSFLKLCRMRASGTTEGALKGWDTRGRVNHAPYEHGIHIGVFDRPEHPNQYAPLTTKFFAKPAPSKAEREAVMRAFKNAVRLGTRDVNLKDLIPMQRTIVQRRVDRLMDVREDHEWLRTHIPTVFKHNGNSYVIDGHHRIAMDSMRGMETLPAVVFGMPPNRVGAA